MSNKIIKCNSYVSMAFSVSRRCNNVPGMRRGVLHKVVQQFCLSSNAIIARRRRKIGLMSPDLTSLDEAMRVIP